MLTDIPNLRHLRLFQLTLRHRSVNRASREANLSQPAVTQAIAKIERSFGALLFERRSGGMTPTPAGELLGLRVERTLSFIDEAGRQLAAHARQRRGATASMFPRAVSVSQLRALMAIARTGSFASAARLLGLSQPSVHRATSQLQGLADVTLLERTSSGLALTRMGQVVARTASLAFQEIRLAHQDLSNLKGLASGRVVGGSLPLAQSRILPDAIHALSRRFPNISIAVVDGAYEFLVDELLRGSIDLLVGALRGLPPASGGAESPLTEDRLSVLARIDHPLQSRADLTSGDLFEYGWVVGREGAPGRAAFNAMFERAGVALPTGLVETGSLATLRGLLLNSDRLAMLSPRQAHIEIEAGLLRPLAFELPETNRVIGLALRSDFVPTTPQSLFIEELQRAARPDAVPRWPNALGPPWTPDAFVVIPDKNTNSAGSEIVDATSKPGN